MGTYYLTILNLPLGLGPKFAQFEAPKLGEILKLRLELGSRRDPVPSDWDGTFVTDAMKNWLTNLGHH